MVNLGKAAKLRAQADYLVGINGTRAYTSKIGGFGNVISIGRVQTPVLNMIVQRQEEIEVRGRKGSG